MIKYDDLYLFIFHRSLDIVFPELDQLLDDIINCSGKVRQDLIDSLIMELV